MAAGTHGSTWVGVAYYTYPVSSAAHFELASSPAKFSVYVNVTDGNTVAENKFRYRISVNVTDGNTVAENKFRVEISRVRPPVRCVREKLGLGTRLAIHMNASSQVISTKKQRVAAG